MEGEATTCWPKTIVTLPPPPDREFGFFESRLSHFGINLVMLAVVLGMFVFKTQSHSLDIFTTSLTVQNLKWLPLIVVLGLDLGSHLNFNTAIRYLHKDINAAVNTERSKVTTQNLTPEEKNNLFYVLQNADLFNYRDTCILLRREFSVSIFSMIPWVFTLVVLLSVKFNPTPPEGLAQFVGFTLFLKAVTISSFWVFNVLRLRTVKLYLFGKPVGR